MKTPVQKMLTEAFANAVKAAFPSLSSPPVTVARAANPKFGDFQFNSSMSIFKQLKGTDGAPKNPREVAQAIQAQLPGDDPMISKTEIAGPGFINVHISATFLGQHVLDMATQGVQPYDTPKRKCLVDFSSPNIAKEMHVGHLRSTIIGDCVCRVLEFLGHDVERINHTGDWGTQFGMLITHLRAAHPDFTSNTPDVTDLTSFYKQAKQRFDEDDQFKETSRLEVVQLQSGNPDSLTAWKALCDVSRKAFQAVYDRLDIKIGEVGESFYNPMIPGVVEKCKAKGLVKESDGAQVILQDDWQFPLIVVKRDGGFGYDSTDMAAIDYRINEKKGDWLIYITDAGQGDHFKLIFKAAELMGWSQGVRVDHMGFGLVCGEDGKKFKTRSGETVKLVDLLDEACDRTYNVLKERNDEEGSQVTFTEEEMLNISKVIGYAAVKYADLKTNRQLNYIFSFDRMLDLKGNTAVYLLYAFARINSIFRKANVDINSPGTAIPSLEHPAEKALAMHILSINQEIALFCDNLCPHVLCTFLYETSVKFSEFFRDCKVVGDAKQEERLILIAATARCMKQVFTLLGIDTIDRM